MPGMKAAVPERDVRERELTQVAARPDAFASLTARKPEKVAQLNREAADGHVSDWVRAAADAEEKDSELGQALQTRKKAVLACDITLTPADDSAQAQKIAEALREIWRELPRKREVLSDLLDAIYLGFALAQIRLSETPIEGYWRVAAVDTIDPAALTFRDEQGVIPFPRLLTAAGTEPYGMDLTEYREVLVFHQVRRRGSCLRGGLARTLLWLQLFKSFNLKDWLAFNDKYGLPFILGKYHSGASPDERAKLQAALRALGSDASGIIPDGAEIEIREVAKAGSVMAFDKLWTRLDEAVVKTVLGQTKTSMGDGGSLALAEVHNEVRSDITQADINALTETLNEQLIKRLVLWNFGPGALNLTPTLSFVYVNEKKRQARLADIQKGHELGLDLGEAFVRRELNLPEPEEGEAVIQGKRQQLTTEGTEGTQRNATAGMNPAREGGGTRPFRGIKGKPWIK